MGLWSEETKEALKALAGQGYSASQAASHFDGMTRNAAVGLAHRMQFQFHGSSKNRVYTKSDRPRTSIPAKIAPKQTWKCAEAVAPSTPVTFAELEPHHCRFPIGDPIKPDFAFCGGNKHDGYSYCGFHCRIAFETPEERRDRTISSR